MGTLCRAYLIQNVIKFGTNSYTVTLHEGDAAHTPHLGYVAPPLAKILDFLTLSQQIAVKTAIFSDVPFKAHRRHPDNLLEITLPGAARPYRKKNS
jgi:hypothetical protein